MMHTDAAPTTLSPAVIAKAIAQALALVALSAASVALAIGVVGRASAQLVEPSAFTPATVTPIDPFGDLSVDVEEIDRHRIVEFMEAIGREQRMELEQRCSVVTVNGQLYDPITVQFCTSVLVASVR